MVNLNIELERVNKIKMIATDLIKYYSPEYTLVFSKRFTRTLGQTRDRQKLITLQYRYVVYGAIADIIDTILHEIAHTLDSTNSGHSPVWKTIASHLGCKPSSKLKITLNKQILLD